MVSAKPLTSKVQHDGGIQIPKEIRAHLKLEEGDPVIWVIGALGTVYLKRGELVEATA